MRELIKYLKPLKKRIYIKIIINTVSISLAVALLLDAALLMYAKFVYVYGVFDIALIMPVLILCISLVFVQFFLPSDYKVAKIADSLGFKERFVTAYEIFQKKEADRTQLEILAVEDALKCAEKGKFKEIYPIKPNRCVLLAPIFALLLVAVVYFLPIEPSENMEEQREMHELLDNTVEEMKKEIDASNLTSTQKKELKNEVNALKKELSRVENKTEAANSLMQGQAKLKKLTTQSENKQLQAIGNKLAENKATQGLGELIKSGNIQELTEAVDNINKSLDNMTEEEIKALGEAFKEAAKDSELNQETAQLLNELGETMEKELTEEQLRDISQKLNEFSDKINELAKENQDIREAVEKLNNQMAKANDKLTGNISQNPQGQQGTVNQETPEDNTQISGNAGNREGNSQGDTPGGTGVGKGSIPNANIYTSQAKQYKDYDAELDENSNGEKTGDLKNTKVNGEKGEIVPYQEVFNQYKEEAMNNIDKEEIPYGLKDIVRDYFTSLE